MQHICEFVNYKPAYNLHWQDENGQNHKNLITMTSNLKECSHKTKKKLDEDDVKLNEMSA